jgi:hypothetical protein
MSRTRPSIDAEQGKAWIAEGERAARSGAPIEDNPYDGREEQVQRLLWLRGYLRSTGPGAAGPTRRWA